MAGRIPSRGSDQFVVRFPDGMRDQIRGEAEKNGRSMNAEIVARLEESLTREASPRIEDLRAMQDELRELMQRAVIRGDVLDRLDAKESPNRYYERYAEMLDDMPEEERPAARAIIVNTVRRVTGNPDWNPDEEANTPDE